MLTQDSITTLTGCVQDALERNTTPKGDIRDERLERRLWDAMHQLNDLQDDLDENGE